MMRTGSTDDQPVANDTFHNRSRASPKPVSPPDGGWGWVVTIASFFISMIVDGVSNTFGILYPHLLNAFGESKGKTQSVNSVMYGTILILGFGMALVYPTSLVIVSIYFEKRRALATGIAVCGSGVGALVFAPICEFLLGIYGWRGAVWIMSGVVLNMVVCAALYRSIGEQGTPTDLISSENTTVNGEAPPQINTISTCSRACHFLADIFDFSLLTHPVYAVYTLSTFLYFAGYQIPFSYLPAQAMSIQLSSQESALLISIIGISTTLSRVLIGYVSDKPWANTIIMNSTMLMIGGMCTCLVPYYTTFSVLSVCSAVYGAVTATYASLVTVNLIKLMGLQRLSCSLGTQFMCMGVGLFVGSPIAGVLSDVSGDYKYTFYFGGCLIGVGGLVCLPLNCMARREQKRNCNINGSTDLSCTIQETSNVTLESFNEVSETSA